MQYVDDNTRRARRQHLKYDKTIDLASEIRNMRKFNRSNRVEWFLKSRTFSLVLLYQGRTKTAGNLPQRGQLSYQRTRTSDHMLGARNEERNLEPMVDNIASHPTFIGQSLSSPTKIVFGSYSGIGLTAATPNT